MEEIDWDDLSISEFLIAGLAASGLLNKEIAKICCISGNTVRAHLHNIYNKSHMRGDLHSQRRGLARAYKASHPFEYFMGNLKTSGSLSAKEYDSLACIAQGDTDQKAGDTQSISRNTVRYHLQGIRRKLTRADDKELSRIELMWIYERIGDNSYAVKNQADDYIVKER